MKKGNVWISLCASLVVLLSCGNSDVKLNQTISFDYLAPHNISESSFTLKAKATSGLPVIFLSSDTTIASIKDSTIHLLKPGNVDITAVQSGDSKYYAAGKVTRILTVNEDNNAVKKNQTIAFELNDTIWKVSKGYLTLKATASSGLPVTFTSSNIVYAAITGNQLEVSSGAIVGNNDGVFVVITASQSGNYLYNAAPTVSHTLRVIHDVH
jgi:hypothetical protein